MFKLIMTDVNGSKWLVSAPDELREELVKFERDPNRHINWGNFQSGSNYFDDNCKSYNVTVTGRHEIELKAY